MNPKVSVCCITYNHENYISTAIKSFLNQKCSYPIEIIVSDDNSKDDTISIINDIKAINPGLISVYVNRSNIGMMRNFIKVFGYANGEYIAYCDGDDFWTDSKKLEKQIQILEKNPAISFVFHDVCLVDEDGHTLGLLSNGRDSESFTEGIISSEVVIGAPLRIVHANALLFRRKSLEDMSFLETFSDSPAPDFTLVSLLASQGNGYYFKEVMSAYRKHSNSVSNKRGIDKKLLDRLKDLYKRLDKYFLGRFHSEFVRGYKGHLIMSVENKMNQAVELQKFSLLLTSVFKLLWYYKGSQYTLKDVLWLIKEGGRKFFSKKKASDK